MIGARFDAYTATTRALGHAAAVALVGVALPGHRLRQGPGYHRFEHRIGFQGEDGAQAAAVLWGGSHQDLVMIEAKGETTSQVVDAVRQAAPHRCTRADSCADFEELLAWDRIVHQVHQVKREFGLRGERRGDWEFPEDGRTQYLGAASSAVRVRCYEKGKEPELRHLGRFDLVRVEVQVRPERGAREAYSRLNAVQVWGASPYTRALATRLLQLDVTSAPARGVQRKSEREQALRWMCEQYGGHLVSLSQDLGGWDVLGMTLREMVAEARSRRDRRR